MVAIRGHFDGKVIVPDEPVDLPSGQRLIVHLERADTKPSGEDEAGAAWAAGIAKEWETELSDPREDIYTMEDGEPVDLSRDAIGTPGAASLKFAGTIDAESVREMSIAIAAECERVDDEWQ